MKFLSLCHPERSEGSSPDQEILRYAQNDNGGKLAMSSYMDGVKLEDAKKVITYDHSKNVNGFLIEMFRDGKKTSVYLSAALPGAFKGYHLHRVRAANYICLKGRMKLILYKGQKREEYILDASQPQRLHIPNNIATGLQNIGDEEGWLVNFPDPAYDPDLKDEQVEYTEEELEKGIVK